MGVRLWCYLRTAPGEIRQITQKALVEFVNRRGRLDPDQDFVRYVEVVVESEGAAFELCGVGFFEAPAPDGMLSSSVDVRRWQPLDSDTASLRELVNRRARTAVLG